MNPAKQALDLLRNQVTAADIAEMSDNERQQLAANCHHWAMLIDVPRNIPSEKSFTGDRT